MLHNESQMSEDELSIYELALKKNINLYKCKDKDNKFINWTKATYMADPMILSNAYEKARMYLRRHGDYKKVKKFSPILEKQLNEIKNIIDSNKKIDSNDEIVKQLTQDKKIFNFHKEKMEEIKKYIKINIENFKEEIMGAKDKYKDKIIKKYRNIILIYLASARLDDKQKFFKLFVEKADNIKIDESDSADEKVNNDNGHIEFKKKNKINSEDNIRRINEELKRQKKRFEKYQHLKTNKAKLNYLDDIAKGQKRGRQKAIYILLMSRLKYAGGSPDLTIATPFGDVKMNLSSQELNSGCRLTTRQVSNALTEKLNPAYSKLINDICAILKTDDQKNQFFEILREYINFQCKPEKGNKCQLVKIIEDQLKNNKYGYEEIEELSMDITDIDDLGELVKKACQFTEKLGLDHKKLIKLRGQMAEFCAISCLCEPLIIGSKFQDAVFKKSFKNNYEKYNDTVSWENSDFDNNNNKKENIKNEEKENEDEENEDEENEEKENEDEENEYEEKDDEEDNDYNKSNKNIKNKMLGKKSKKKYKNNSDNDSKNSSNNKNKKKKLTKLKN